MAFESLSDRLQETLKKVTGQATLTEANMEEMLREIRLALLEADVNYQVVKEFIANTKEKINDTKEKTKSRYQQFKENRAQRAQEKALQKQLEVKAEPVIESNSAVKQTVQENNVQNINYKKNLDNQSQYTPINIQRTRKNNLYGNFDNTRPPLRDYN